MNHKVLAALTFLALVSLTIPGCVTPPVDTYGAMYGPPVQYGYEPLLYDGYVVYYTDIGEPYYWLGGARIWVPSYARSPYVGHWQRYKQVYPTWYKHRGAYYKTHRFTGRAGNPRGPAGGPGTNWRHPPGPVGGSGTSPSRPYDTTRYPDRDSNRPGPAGGPGTNWEHRPGPPGRLETSPDRGPGGHRSRDGNPPGPTGGPGTNWENPPGPAGEAWRSYLATSTSGAPPTRPRPAWS